MQNSFTPVFFRDSLVNCARCTTSVVSSELPSTQDSSSVNFVGVLHHLDL